MLEILFEIVGEFVLEFVVEVLAELGLHSLKSSGSGDVPLWLAALGYTLFGTAAGGLSLLVFPAHFVTNPTFRLASLVVTPVAAGLAMAAIGSWRRKRGQALHRLDRFFCGYIFALALAFIRFYFAQ